MTLREYGIVVVYKSTLELVGGGNGRERMSHHRKPQPHQKAPKKSLDDSVKAAFAQEVMNQATIENRTKINISHMLTKVRTTVGNSKLTIKTLLERLECWIKKGWMKVVENNFIINHSGLTQILQFAET